MKALLFLLLAPFALICKAQPVRFSGDGFFDPFRDPVAMLMPTGRMRPVVEEECLARAVRVKLPRVGRLEKLDCQEIEGQWWIAFESRMSEDLEQSVFVGVRLKPGSNGDFFADSYWTACTGEGCGGCDFKLQMDGCFCRFDKPGEPGTPGACYQTTSDEPLLVKVPLKAP